MNDQTEQTLHCEELHYPSADGTHTVAAYLYTMQGVELRAVLQLSHGMCEYIRRYEPMAAWYAERGIALAGNDHLGHGGSAAPDERGHYGEKNGAEHLLKDLHTMNGLLHERFPTLPIILYGHSMGSFYARWYAEKWPDTIRALILSGTCGPSAVNAVGAKIAAAVAALHGDRYVSPLLVKLNFGKYCTRIKDPASPNAWLTRVPEIVAAYDADPLCSFDFTAGSYREMLRVISHVNSKRWAAAFPKALPVLFVSGDADPVGDYGAGVRAAWALLGDAGVSDLSCQIWPDARHELHNESNREGVFDYILTWLEDRI